MKQSLLSVGILVEIRLFVSISSHIFLKASPTLKGGIVVASAFCCYIKFCDNGHELLAIATMFYDSHRPIVLYIGNGHQLGGKKGRKPGVGVGDGQSKLKGWW